MKTVKLNVGEGVPDYVAKYSFEMALKFSPQDVPPNKWSSRYDLESSSGEEFCMSIYVTERGATVASVWRKITYARNLPSL